MLIPDPTNSETTQLSIQRILGCSSGIYIFEDAPKWILMQVVPSLCEECWLRTCKAIRNQCHLNKLSFKKYKGRKRKHIITEMLKDKLVSFFRISCLSFHRILEGFLLLFSKSFHWFKNQSTQIIKCLALRIFSAITPKNIPSTQGRNPFHLLPPQLLSWLLIPWIIYLLSTFWAFDSVHNILI